jgi:cell division protease FtsH
MQQNSDQGPGGRQRIGGGQGPPGPMGQLNRSGCGSWGLWLILLAAIGFAVFNIFGAPGSSATEISYTTFHQQLENGNVASVTINNQQIKGQLKSQATTQNAQGQSVQYKDFVTYIPSFGDSQLLTLMQNKGVQIQVQPPSSGVSWLAILSYVLPLLLLFGVGYIFYRQMRSQGQNIMSGFGMRKSGATLYERSKERTTFDDVAGLQGAKTELEEIIEFLKNPSYFQRLGGEVPRGVLLVGPPGTGKTLLARAVAGEANVPFFSITGSNFMEMLVGVGASRVRDLFEEAKKASPSIIFIDELDSIGRRRGAGLGGGHDEREQTLNQLLSEMDGFEPNEGVIVMAATNRPDILDPALLRPGRFDRRISADLPTMQDRLEILKIHGRNKPMADDIDMEEVARGTPGFSGADLENLLNEAALLAARRGKDRIERDDIEEARDKVIMGLERENLALSDEEMRLLAYHEGGHAIVAAVLPNADPIHKVTIVPRGRAMGVTQQLPERDKYVYKREYMLDRLAVMMGGRAAENLVLKTSTSGAENDLKQATVLARKMVLDWGMSKRLGHVAFGTRGDQVFLGQEIAQRRDYSETTAREVDEEVQSLLDESYNLAVTTLEERREDLDRLADALVEHEELAGSKVLELLGIDEEKATISFEGDGNKGSED